MAGTDGPRPLLSLVAADAGSAFYGDRVDRAGGPALVLGAGDGRIAWELARRGHQVLAADPSEALLRAVEERRGQEPPEVSARLRVVRADVRSLRLDERFKVAISPRNALGLMSTRDDLEAALATARTHLLPDGIFLLDLVNPPEHRAPPAPGDRAEEPPLWYRPVFVPHLRERRRARPGEAEHEGLRRLRVRQFSAEVLDAALKASGFTPMERYGDFDGRPFAPEDPLQVVVAQLEP
ncbi:MAG TPA: class I SAM-dependent methyltransferase [Myxococcales bacterium]|jgi:SAM-dependent methyltransferase|nr:class I SAM-dependent methyltransferase [Myxococcales bacterium]